MTKTLTEQYKNKELHGWYYVKTKDGSINHWLLFTDTIEFEKDIEEVLAPVPSYDKVKEMSQKIERLEFDNEVLEMAHNEGKEINAELVSKTEQLEKKLEILRGLLEHALQTMGQISKLSEDKVDAVQCATSICLIEERLKEMEGVK